MTWDTGQPPMWASKLTLGSFFLLVGKLSKIVTETQTGFVCTSAWLSLAYPTRSVMSYLARLLWLKNLSRNLYL